MNWWQLEIQRTEFQFYRINSGYGVVRTLVEETTWSVPTAQKCVYQELAHRGCFTAFPLKLLLFRYSSNMSIWFVNYLSELNNCIFVLSYSVCSSSFLGLLVRGGAGGAFLLTGEEGRLLLLPWKVEVGVGVGLNNLLYRMTPTTEYIVPAMPTGTKYILTKSLVLFGIKLCQVNCPFSNWFARLNPRDDIEFSICSLESWLKAPLRIFLRQTL